MEIIENRISRDDMFMDIALKVSERSTCPRKKVGAVLVKDNRIIAISYNGVLPGEDPNKGIDKDGKSVTVHAEANLIAFCAKNGIATEGCNMYLTLSPCYKCAELIIQSGIKQVYYLEKYRDDSGILLLNKTTNKDSMGWTKSKFDTICRQYIK